VSVPWQLAPRAPGAFFSELGVGAVRRNLRLASGLILFAYITCHLANHALGLISLDVAESGLRGAVAVWHSLPGTVLLYGAFAIHFLLALWAVYERRTFRLPPVELLRIALGFSLPVLLIGHAAATRLAYELFALAPDYTRVVANLWASDSQGRQLGLLAPGWLHGCLGLHLAFNRRPFYQRWRYVLFAAALLLPVLSALGFIAMSRELANSPAAAAAALEFLSPVHAAKRIAIAQWRDGLLTAYFLIIGAAFGAREIRNGLERSRRRLVAISYPARTVRVPRGWTVLEASRSFHLAHASMCGGRARCSTCRVRVIAGAEFCPPPQSDEQATLERIHAPADVRLACQLRPQGDVAVIPLVRTEAPNYRPEAPQPSAERAIVVLICDFLNRAEVAVDHLQQDVLYVLTLYVDAIAAAIRAAGGTLSYVEPESICALFGLRSRPAQAAAGALQAAGDIERMIADLNDRLGRQWHCKMNVAVSVHAGRAAVGEIGGSNPPATIAVGEAIDAANALRRAAAAEHKCFAISEAVYAAAGITPVFTDQVTVQPAGFDAPIAVFLSDLAPAAPSDPAGRRDGNWRTAWQRLTTRT
jgi:adenylate cyclase